MERIENEKYLAAEILTGEWDEVEGDVFAEYQLWDGRIVRLLKNSQWKKADASIGVDINADIEIAMSLVEKLLREGSIIVDRGSDDMLRSFEWTVSVM
jgi:hypothetical protein